ncbi:hypothetical protein NMY22_g18233 [Coprinellus aureogranulatus]|nr:hypothetical protein NMY22_g18233 [Coprinellus aureogranulatus]
MSSSQHAFQLKEAGNKFFKEKSYDAAIKKFSEAIALEPRNPTFYGNRAACFYFTGRYQQVITDCQMALQLDPRYAKAWLRKADAQTSHAICREHRVLPTSSSLFQQF